ncbi:MAG: large subunit ribosomal protein L4 [Parcubacteria group bacterium Gr01-1014_8]|nr:MAG: large subunit ribosomal protein L4 [Parcubacteria group bacterium Gr01-1014_8]
MKYDVYNTQGKKSGSVELPERVFDVAWNDSLMHQVVTSMLSNARTPVAHVKERGEVRGGGKKPWQQKGTGRARHGSIRSPIWRGGGVTHGPRNEKSYAREIPRKMRIKALAMALSRKLKSGEVVFVDSFGIDAPKTALAKKAIASLGKALGFNAMHEKTRNAALVALADPREASVKSFRNIANIECRAVRELNPVSVMRNSYLVIENPEAAVAILAHRFGEQKKDEKKAPAKTKRAKASVTSVREVEKGDQ